MNKGELLTSLGYQEVSDQKKFDGPIIFRFTEKVSDIIKVHNNLLNWPDIAFMTNCRVNDFGHLLVKKDPNEKIWFEYMRIDTIQQQLISILSNRPENRGMPLGIVKGQLNSYEINGGTIFTTREYYDTCVQSALTNTA